MAQAERAMADSMAAALAEAVQTARAEAAAQAQSARLHGPVEIALDLAASVDGGTPEDRNRMRALLEQFLRGDAHDV